MECSEQLDLFLEIWILLKLYSYYSFIYQSFKCLSINKTLKLEEVNFIPKFQAMLIFSKISEFWCSFRFEYKSAFYIKLFLIHYICKSFYELKINLKCEYSIFTSLLKFWFIVYSQTSI